jgi:hypothetical protein
MEEQPLSAGGGSLDAQVETLMSRLWRSRDEVVEEFVDLAPQFALEREDIELAAGGALHQFADAAIDADAFARQVRHCETFDLPMFATEMADGLVPLDMRAWLSPASMVTRALYRDVARDLVSDVVHASEASAHPIVPVPPDSASESFVSRLADFVRTRLSAGGGGDANQRIDDPYGPPGTLITVQTRRRGLRVYYSPFYWLTDDRVFGAPTTPVQGYLEPGDYRFGCSGRGQTMSWDPGRFEIPRLTDVVLQV